MSIETVEPSDTLIEAQLAFREVNQQIRDLGDRLNAQKEIVSQAEQSLVECEAIADKTLARVALGEAEDMELSIARKAVQEARIALSEAEDLAAGQLDASKLLLSRRKEVDAAVQREQRRLVNGAVESRRRGALEAAQQALENVSALLSINGDMFDLQAYLNSKGILYTAHQAGVKRANHALRELNTAGERHGL